MPTSPLEASHTTLFKSSIRKTPPHPASTAIPADPSGAWPSSLLSHSHLEPHEWTYLAEGGKSLLIRFDGDCHAAKNGWVNHNASKALALRLSKKPRGDDLTSKEAASSTGCDRDLFESRVAGPLLGSKSLLPCSTKLTLPKGNTFLQKVAARIEMQRPRERRAADGIDVSADYIEVVEDLSWSPPRNTGGAASTSVLAIEIKPKWLFSNDPTSSASRYRKHHVLRIPDISKADFDALYEPLDLVSGDSKRIQRAAEGLTQNWLAGGNNLRVFVDGKSVHPSNASSIQPLLASLSNSTQSASSSVVDTLASILTQVVSSNQVKEILSRLARLQASLAPIDLESLSTWFSAQTRSDSSTPFATTNADHSDLIASPALDEFATYAQDWLALQASQSQGDREADVALTLRQAIIGTVLSATFKDCSLFLRLSPRHANTPTAAQQQHTVQAETVTAATEYEDTEGTGTSRDDAPYLSRTAQASPSTASHDQIPFGYTVKIIDVDPKPVDKLPHWLSLERQIEQAYAEWTKRAS